MRFSPRNRWNVQVNFKGWCAFGLKNLPNMEHTPDSVIEALDDFLKRAKQARKRYRARLREIQRDPVKLAEARRRGILPAATD